MAISEKSTAKKEVNSRVASCFRGYVSRVVRYLIRVTRCMTRVTHYVIYVAQDSLKRKLCGLNEAF